MKLIEKLSDMIEEELCDAEKYIKCAMNYKEDHPVLASTFARLSNEEMGHVNLLHDQVEILINEYRKEHGEPPEKMAAVYEYLHNKQIRKATEIKAMQAIYRS